MNIFDMNICEHSLHADKKYQTKAKCVCCTSSCLPLAHQDTLRAFPRHPLEEVHCPTTRHMVPPSFHESMRCPCGVHAVSMLPTYANDEKLARGIHCHVDHGKRGGNVRGPSEVQQRPQMAVILDLNIGEGVKYL